jgi:hypothetical protein
MAGNHESVNMNQMYGFFGEVKSKYPLILKDKFSKGTCDEISLMTKKIIC